MFDIRFVTKTREPFYQIALDVITPNSVVLDIGSGNGSFSDFCKRKDFYLMDANHKTVETLKLTYPNTVHGALPLLPFPSAFFDVIHCSHVIEHLQSEDLYNSLIEMDRCLNNSGYLVISTPLLSPTFYNDLSHVRPYPPAVLMKYMCNSQEPYPNLTRQLISQAYTTIHLQYRYREIFPSNTLYNSRHNFVVWFYRKLLGLLYRFGARHYETNGYTIVMQKQASQ